MALSLWRWGSRRQRIAPADPRRYDLAASRPIGQYSEPPDDYLVEAETQTTRAPVAVQAARVLQFVLLLVIALLSLAVFWMIGLILGIF